MKLYDKKYVYFEWDDRLEGKEVFYVDVIGRLKKEVEENEPRGVCYKNVGSSNAEYPFEVDETNWSFVYYDPLYDVKRAFIEGKQIQFKDYNGTWYDTSNPEWRDDREYRVKPMQIEDLETENAELRRELEFQQSLSIDRHFQLERSEEIIRDLLTCLYSVEYDKVSDLEKAEQFLKEVTGD